MTLIYLDDQFAVHDTGNHPECIERITRLNAAIRASEVLSTATFPVWQNASQPQITSVHSPEYVQQLESWCAAGAGRIEADTVVSQGSWLAAVRGAGAAIDAVNRVVDEEAKRAFCAIRPPGHHALPGGPMGFCLLNNIAIAARSAIARGLRSVLIVDWDVHHGNGTQDAFYEDGQIGFYSIHRSPFYPGTGAKDETGSGRGLGWIYNEPVSADISKKQFLDCFQRGVEDLAGRVKPELILLSAGFDAHQNDPVGGLCLEEQDYGDLTAWLIDVAENYCGGKLVSLLEGGYHLTHMPSSALEHVEKLM
ncbi:MAG: histone deacetylase [Pirellulaceae bacterium]